jgi:cytochrome c-type biogenesis protein CcmH/NrfG
VEQVFGGGGCAIVPGARASPPVPTQGDTRVNRNVVIALAAGLVAGLVVGYSIGQSMGQPSGPVVAAPTVRPVPDGGMPGGMGGGMPAQVPGAAAAPSATQLDERIATHEKLVKQDPKDVHGWVQLGNDYFDTHQPQKSIDAYAKALALRPDDADVLTDQGIMYRELGQFDRAAKNFERASEVNPKHLQSLFNLGVVYAYDLKQADKAVAAWTKVIQIDPMSTQAVQARTALQQIQAGK